MQKQKKNKNKNSDEDTAAADASPELSFVFFFFFFTFLTVLLFCFLATGVTALRAGSPSDSTHHVLTHSLTYLLRHGSEETIIVCNTLFHGRQPQVPTCTLLNTMLQFFYTLCEHRRNDLSSQMLSKYMS